MPRDLFHRGGRRGLSSALSDLSQSLTINGTTKTPTFRYDGQNSSTTLWTATVGTDLPIAGSGAETAQGEVPLINTTDKSAQFDSGKFFQAAASATADVTTEDIVFELVMKNDVTSKRFLDKRGASGAGYTIYQTSSLIVLLIDTGATSVFCTGTIPLGSWNHLMAFVDRSGSAIWYVNGAAASAASFSAASATLTNANDLTIGARADATNNMTGDIAYCAMWQHDAWLDSHLQPTIAAARAKTISGASTNDSRASLAYLHKPIGGAKKYFLMGSNWMRLAQDLTGKPYYLDEAAATNIITNSNTFTADAGITVAKDEASPFSGELATMVTEDASTGIHYTGPIGLPVADGVTYAATLFIKPAGRTHVRISNSKATGAMPARAIYSLSGAGSVVSQEYGDSAAIESIGDSWYKLTLIGTATGADTPVWYINAMSDETTTSYTGNSADAFAIIHFKVAAEASASSPILTAGAAATRAADA